MDFVQEIEAIGEKVKADVKEWAGEAEQFGASLFHRLWDTGKSVALALEPKLMAEFSSHFDIVIHDVETGDFADVETAIANLASDELKTAMEALKSPSIQTLIGLLKGAAASVAAIA